MPVLIIIGIIIIIHNSRKSNRKRKTRYFPAPPVYDPVKLQKLNAAQEREADRKRREYERQEDRARKEDERKAKAQESRQAARDKIEWLTAMIERYSALSEAIETELAENPGLTEYKRIQLQKQSLQTEEKIRKLHEQRDKAYFIANH